MELESTVLLRSLAELKLKLETPATSMELIRRAVSREAARANEVEMPPIFNDTQRQEFLNRVDKLSLFLQSEDGKDAVELFMATWNEYVSDCEKAEVLDEAPPLMGEAEQELVIE